MTRIALLVMLLLAGCSRFHGHGIIDGSRGLVVTPAEIAWTEEELARDVAVIELRRGSWSSEHIVRLKGAEKPHMHERHDLSVTLLYGSVRMHVGDQEFLMSPGTVATIPHGL